MRHLLLLLGTLVLAAACGSADDKPNEATCAEPCGSNMVCDDGACVCEPGFVDCDANPANGCIAESVCGCNYEGDAAFCARNEANCGSVAALDNCGNWRVAECGACENTRHTCGAEAPHMCGYGGCEPETPEAVCVAQGWLCGVGPGTDRCGNVLELDCGTCAQGLKCGPHHTCVDAGADAYEGCIDHEDCAPPLECVQLSPTARICAAVCTRSSDCEVGQRCALPSGSDEGLCGNWRGLGESCQMQHEGPYFCWDDTSEAALLCLEQTCQYVCAMQDEWAEVPCPTGLVCAPEYVASEEYGRYVRLCERQTGQ